MMIHKKAWENFVLSCDFKIAKGCNSGIFIRTVRSSRGPTRTSASTAWRCRSWTARPPASTTPAIYDLVKPTENAMKPVGEWNHIVVTCDKNLIEVEARMAKKVNRIDLDEWTEPNKRPDGTQHKFDIAYKNHPAKGIHRPPGSRRRIAGSRT